MIEKRYRDVPGFEQRFISFLLLVVITTYCSAGEGQNENSPSARPKQKEAPDPDKLLELIPDNHDQLMKAIEQNGPITDSKVRTMLLEKALESRDWKSALMLLDKKHSGSIDDHLDRWIELVRSAPKAEDSSNVEVLKKLYKSKIRYLERKKRCWKNILRITDAGSRFRQNLFSEM